MDTYDTETIRYWLSQLRPNHIITSPTYGIDWLDYLPLMSVSTLMIILTAIIAWCLFRHHQQKQVQVCFHKRLLHIERAYSTNKNTSVLLASYNALMKALLLQYQPVENIPSLYGKKWLDLLDKTGKTNVFTQGEGRCLGSYYQESSLRKINIAALSSSIRSWIRQIEHG